MERTIMKAIKNMKILHKLLFLILIFAISLVSISYFSISRLSQTAKNSETIYNEQLVPSELFSTINVDNRAINAYLLELLITEDPTRNQYLSERIDAYMSESESLLNELSSVQLETEVMQQLDLLVTLNTDLNIAREQVKELAMNNENTEAYELFQSDIEDKRAELDDLLENISDLNSSSAKESYELAISTSEQAKQTVIIVIIISTLITSVVGVLIARFITKPIRDIQELLGLAEQGDFTVVGHYESKDEIGMLNRSFNSMIEGVNKVIRTVGETSEQVAASSEELSASAEQSTRSSEHISETIQELAVRAEDQVKNIEESTAVIHEINSSTQQIYENTEKVTQTVHQAAQMSGDGRKVIDQVNEQMNFIDSKVSSLAGSFNTLSVRSKEIGNIIEVITNIAAQTNLLALNAAIEAARTGEHGKGFAVVADEVRKLAEESSHSAEQISGLVSQIQSDTAETMETVNNTTNQVKEGIVVVEEAGKTFAQIETVITGVVPQINEVSDLIKELLAGTDHVYKSIVEVQEVSQETASGTQSVTAATEEQLAAMEEIASSAQSLAYLAENLQDLIKQFKL